jgi:hypothetical protein
MIVRPLVWASVAVLSVWLMIVIAIDSATDALRRHRAQRIGIR